MISAGKKDLILLSGPTFSTNDRRLLNLATAMGAAAKRVTVTDERDCESLIRGLHLSSSCLAMSADTLSVLHRALSPASRLHEIIGESNAELLVFGCNGSPDQHEAIEWLSSGVVRRVCDVNSPVVRFAFPGDDRSFSSQFAGLEFSQRRKEPVPVFELHDAVQAGEIIVSANDRPMFIQIHRGSLHIFLLSGPLLADLEQPLSREDELREHYDQLIPVLIFLRHCLKDSCWYGPLPTARLIIDDPLLTDIYGFLNYGDLQKSMESNSYGTSIAFIPWNYRRTSRQGAARLLGETARLSICIHGCDHTNKEFETEDPAHLNRLAGLAMQRMEFQKKRIGAEFERVMVFPQGKFSTAAVPALRSSNYLAAVNTSCFPTDYRPSDLTLGDLLQPAVTRYDGFPIFQREYPTHLIDFAFNLFVGKPALVVEHHGYFRNGVERLERFVEALHRIQPDLTWPSLTSQLTRSCQVRKCENGTSEVRFFTRDFQLTHRSSESSRYVLIKHEPDQDAVQSVLCNGSSIPFSFDKDFLKLEITVDYPGQELKVEVLDRSKPQRRVSTFGIAHNARVLLRRGLSEFRDNTLDRHIGLQKLANGVAKELKVTGHS